MPYKKSRGSARLSTCFDPFCSAFIVAQCLCSGQVFVVNNATITTIKSSRRVPTHTAGWIRSKGGSCVLLRVYVEGRLTALLVGFSLTSLLQL